MPLTDIAPYGSYGYSSGGGTLDLYSQDPKRLRKSDTGRALMRVQQQGMIRAAQIGVEEQLMDAKLATATHVGRTAQTEVAMLSQIEAQLIEACGSEVAARRISYIGNTTVLGVSDLVADSVSRLRRM